MISPILNTSRRRILEPLQPRILLLRSIRSHEVSPRDESATVSIEHVQIDGHGEGGPPDDTLAARVVYVRLVGQPDVVVQLLSEFGHGRRVEE